MKFVFSNIAALQAYSQQPYWQMGSLAGIFEGLYLDFKKIILNFPMLHNVLNQAPPNFEVPQPCFQDLWETLF